MCPLVKEPPARMITVSLDGREEQKTVTAEALRHHTEVVENLLIGSRRNFAKAGDSVFVAKNFDGVHIVDAHSGRMVLYKNETPDGSTLKRSMSGFALGVTTAREKIEYPRRPFSREQAAAFNGVEEWPTELQSTRVYRIIGLASESRETGKVTLGALDAYRSKVLAVDGFNTVPKENEPLFRAIIEGKISPAKVVRAINSLKSQQAGR